MPRKRKQPDFDYPSPDEMKYAYYGYGLTNILQRPNKAPKPTDPTEVEIYESILHVLRGRGCSFAEEIIDWERERVLGVTMQGTIVPERVWEYVLAPDNPMWATKGKFDS